MGNPLYGPAAVKWLNKLHKTVILYNFTNLVVFQFGGRGNFFKTLPPKCGNVSLIDLPGT